MTFIDFLKNEVVGLFKTYFPRDVELFYYFYRSLCISLIVNTKTVNTAKNEATLK